MPSEDRTTWNAPAVAALIAAALLPALLTIYFSFQSGGYFPGAPALVAAQLALLVALRIAIGRRPLEGVSAGVLVAIVALSCFAAWVLASTEWSDSPARAVPEYVRVLAYLLALALFGSLPFSARRVRWMAYALAAGIFGVCAVAFLSRTMPDLISGIGELQPSRLSYPLDYWNTLGLLAGLGVILCGHLACASRDHWTARVAGAAAVPLLTATLYYTFSRGATWATLAGVAVYVVVGRPRGLLAGALATVPPTIVDADGDQPGERADVEAEVRARHDRHGPQDRAHRARLHAGGRRHSRRDAASRLRVRALQHAARTCAGPR